MNQNSEKQSCPSWNENIQHDLQKDNTIWDYKMQITYPYNVLQS